MNRRKTRAADRVASALLFALIVLGIGYVGHMDYQDEKAKTSGPVAAYFQE